MLMTTVIGISSSALANIDSAAQWGYLDDDALAREVGQKGIIETATDPHRLYGHKMIDVLNQLLSQQDAIDLNQLASMFYMNERGQTVLQINQDTVSLKVLEFSLSFDGLMQMGNMVADQLELGNNK